MAMSLSSRSAIAVKPATARGVRLATVRPAVVVRATPKKVTEFDSEELVTKATETFNSTTAAIKEKWDKTEDKVSLVLVSSASFVALWLALSITSFVDRIPLISNIVELVGVGASGWFIYRYLTVGPDRDELFVTIKEFINKVYGKIN